ncbi:MAG: hypothetical protein ACXU8A_14450 [Burkholderiaceae bacterium]
MLPDAPSTVTHIGCVYRRECDGSESLLQHHDNAQHNHEFTEIINWEVLAVMAGKDGISSG